MTKDRTDDEFPSLVTDTGMRLFAEGRHERLWTMLGAHPATACPESDPVEGTSFAVWAPRAHSVRVIGDFDGWTGGRALNRCADGQIWEVFVPGASEGSAYKFRVHGADGTTHEKADPFAFATEFPHGNASKVVRARHRWDDAEWLERRRTTDPLHAPMSIYEVHLASWRPGLGYRELADQLTAHVVRGAFTHVELLPVTEHPYGGSWGYQVSSYFAPCARLGTGDDLRYLVDRLHQHGIGVIADWVPAHFARDDWALERFDGAPLYERGGTEGRSPWGTYFFDHTNVRVRNFLIASALFWIEEFHIDGLRVDAVAEMRGEDYLTAPGTPHGTSARRPVEDPASTDFLRELNVAVQHRHPGVMTIAEDSTAGPGATVPAALGGLGFTLKWNMGWMHDTLDYLGRDPDSRPDHHDRVTFSSTYAWSENFLLPLSHDEVVHGKGSLWARMPGADGRRAAGLRVLYAYMWAHPGKKLLFMGQDFGQVAEWSESRGLDWGEAVGSHHSGIDRLVCDLNTVYRRHRALWDLDGSPEGFSWIDGSDAANSVLGFLRHGTDGSVVACLFNFSARTQHGYRVGLPTPGRWREILNTDALDYRGTGAGNLGEVEADGTPWHGLPASAPLTLPASGALYLVRDS